MPKNIELIKASVLELDPSKKYIIVLDKKELSHEDARNLSKTIQNQFGVDNVSVLTGDPSNIKVIEL